jgi:hypothetical protein
MADGAHHTPKRRRRRQEAQIEGLPLDPVVESLSAALGRALARIEYARQQGEEAGRPKAGEKTT